MKKKIMGVILAATLIVSQAVTAFAGSKTSEVVLPNDFAAYYTVTEGTREAFAEAEAVSPQTVDAIIEVNNGSMTLAQLVADMKELLKAEGAAGLKMTEEQVDALAADLGSRTFVTKFFDLEPVNGGIKDDNGDYLVTLSVPAISTAMTEVAFLHFSTDRAAWEVVERIVGQPLADKYGSKTQGVRSKIAGLSWSGRRFFIYEWTYGVRTCDSGNEFIRRGNYNSVYICIDNSRDCEKWSYTGIL